MMLSPTWWAPICLLRCLKLLSAAGRVRDRLLATAESLQVGSGKEECMLGIGEDVPAPRLALSAHKSLQYFLILLLLKLLAVLSTLSVG